MPYRDVQRAREAKRRWAAKKRMQAAGVEPGGERVEPESTAVPLLRRPREEVKAELARRRQEREAAMRTWLEAEWDERRELMRTRFHALRRARHGGA